MLALSSLQQTRVCGRLMFPYALQGIPTAEIIHIAVLKRCPTDSPKACPVFVRTHATALKIRQLGPPIPS